MFRWIAIVVFVFIPLPVYAQPTPTQTLTVAVNEDADNLDPTLARSYVSRIVFAGVCDKLFDIDEQLRIVPQLALSYEYQSATTLVLHLRPDVLFQDGTKMDAEAVAYSLRRHLTFPGSARRAEISALEHTEIIDPLTLKLVLNAPSAPFLSQLTDRAGMIVSPKAAEAAGRDFGLHPVCAGPFKFADRVAQDHVTLDRFADYWNAKDIHFARVIYRPIPDSSIKLANLQSGAIDIAERVATNDVAAVRADKALAVQVYNALGYGSFTVNLGSGPAAQTPFGQNPPVRKAFELSIDRQVLVQVVYAGLFTPLGQGMTPNNPYYNAALPPLPRDVAKAKALLAQAGVHLPVPITLLMVNTPDQLQLGEVVQAMAAEAGFDVKVQSVEFGTGIAAEDSGAYQVAVNGWSGRTDPDGNLYTWLHTGAPNNFSHYSNPEVDSWLDAARLTADPAQRKSLYARITTQLAVDLPSIYLYNTAIIMGMKRRLTGFRPVPDGLIRLQGLTLSP